MRVVLLSTYELGHQPFGLASPAAWLRAAGHAVTCGDLSCGQFPTAAVREAEGVAFYVPMHTATRLAIPAIAKVRRLNPGARLCCFGLYAAANEAWLRAQGVETLISGEFEDALCAWAAGRSQGAALTVLPKLKFRVPDRSGLPPLSKYAPLMVSGEPRVAGYTEASRGCKHLCRHCPIVPVYEGRFRVVDREVVLEDIRRQAAAGARHITFGDPDFFNGPGHAIPLVEALHAGFPELTYDVTIKVEHLLRHRNLLPVLKRTGCLFVTSAVESLDDAVLARLDKGHTRQDFFEVVKLMREAGLALSPTFVPFTPWTTLETYRGLLRALADLDMVENVAPIQLAIRLLIPSGSRLLDLEEVRALVEPFDAEALAWPWRHPLDELCARLQQVIHREDRRGARRSAIFRQIWSLAAAGDLPILESRAAIPFLTEPWYC